MNGTHNLIICVYGFNSLGRET